MKWVSAFAIMFLLTGCASNSQSIERIFERNGLGYSKFIWCSGGSRFVISTTRSVEIFSTQTSQVEFTIPLDKVFDIECSYASNLIALYQNTDLEPDGIIHVWDIEQQILLFTLDTFSHIYDLSWSRSDQELAAFPSPYSESDDPAIFWSTETRRQIAAYANGDRLAWSPNSMKLASVNNFNEVTTWGVGETIDVELSTDNYIPLWSPSGAQIAFTNGTGVFITTITEDQSSPAVSLPLPAAFLSRTISIRDVSWSNAGNRIGIVDTSGGNIYIWDTETFDLLSSVELQNPQFDSNLVWSPSDHLLISIYNGRYTPERGYEVVRLFLVNPANGEIIERISIDQGIRSLSWHPSGDTFALVEESRISIWRTKD